jgi:tRNA-2-methylthio-N6-dimethylallyladenosine synthase
VLEVTLLGQNVNSYASDGVSFPDLLKKICDETNILRLRYTTSHPKDFNEDLCKVHRDYRKVVCDYIHLPVQSGNTDVLHRMNRVYSRQDYLEKVQMIKEYVPGVSLSTDLIVGFPGETEEQFLETLSLIDEVQYDQIYAFKYSPRPFTKAARFLDQVSEDVASDRLTRLLQRHREISFEISKRDLNKTMEVLVEKQDTQNPLMMTGRTSTNKLVHFQGGVDLLGKLVLVNIKKTHPQTLYGEMV